MKPSLADAIKTLKLAVQPESPDFLADQYVETRRNEHEIILGGNKNGLIRLALHCLDLAEHGQHGSHLHLDRISIEVCECPIVIRHWNRVAV